MQHQQAGVQAYITMELINNKWTLIHTLMTLAKDETTISLTIEESTFDV